MHCGYIFNVEPVGQVCVNLIAGRSPGWDFQSYVETACDLVHCCINMVFLVVVSCGRKSA